MKIHSPVGRRDLLRAAAIGGAGFGLSAFFPGWAQPVSRGLAGEGERLSGEDIRLTIARTPFSLGGRDGHAVSINGTVPGPLLRLREGQQLRISVENRLDEDSSIHWHGLLLPFRMDGVPGVSFPGIKPGETFVYEFPVRQSGTYWYHSHSGLQEQQGHYGPIVIDPAAPDPVAYDREHVVMLSDWSFLHPHQLIARLKKEPGYFNRQKMSLLGRLSGRAEDRMPSADRAAFARMRMDPTDILDVTAAAYTYLVNGLDPSANWTGLFTPGERVRLRIVNAAAMTIFNIRIPGLAMKVVAADGQNVVPVEVDELQIGNAETYDVIVEPRDQAYAFVAESMDRSGMALATLAPRPGVKVPAPALRDRPTLTMRDMGMGGHDMSAMAPMADHGSGAPPSGRMNMRDKSLLPDSVKVGVGVDAIAMAPVDRTGDRGLGLEDAGHRVLTYRDLRALAPFHDRRPPTRRIEVHLTGNMERFMWSIDGRMLSENPDPIRLARDERVRFTMINDTMMTHPMHIHGHFFEVVNGRSGEFPVKHTVMVLPGAKLSFDMTADAPGDWAFHCHLLMHMHAGMMRVVTVRPLDGDPA